MSDDSVSNADLLKHILDLKVAVAEMHGQRLPDRVTKLEEHVQQDLQRWAKVGVLGTIASIFGVEVLHTVLKRLGVSP